MDNGLFELPTASASPTRDAGADYSRRDRNDEVFRALVRANDSNNEQVEARAFENSDQRDSGRDPRGDNFAASETVSLQHSNQDDHSVAEPQQTDAAPVTPSDPASQPRPPGDVLGEGSAGDAGLEPTVEAATVDALEALLAAAQQTPAAVVPSTVNPGSGETSPSAVTGLLAASTAAGVSPVPNSGLPEVIAPSGSASDVNTPIKKAAPIPMPPQSPPTDPLAKPGAAAETPTNATQTGTETATSQRSGLAQFVQDASAQALSAATPMSGDIDVSTEAPDTAVTTNGLQAAVTESGKPGAVGEAGELSSLTPPAAPVANAAANGQTPANKQTSPNTGSTTQPRPGTFSPATATQGSAGGQGAGATSNDQASVVREMALAAAADRLTPGQPQPSGNAAPDLAVFRETLATILPDATSTQTTDSARSEGRIVAAQLGARPQLPHPSLTDQVSIRIREAFDAGDSQVRIQLQPKELGRIDIRMEITESGRMSALVIAERPDTLELLMRDARGLERALQQAGFDTDSNSLAFDLQGQDEQPTNQDHGGENIAGETTSGDAPIADEINIDLAALMNGDVSTSGVDIRV